eukprot:s297_g1.t1
MPTSTRTTSSCTAVSLGQRISQIRHDLGPVIRFFHRKMVVKRPTKRLPSVGRMSRVLTFGQRSRPRSIVVMFHGLNDSASCCAEGVAKSWAKLPGVLVVVPQSPDRSLWSDPCDPGYDWLRQEGRQNVKDAKANVRELQRVAMARVRHVEKWLRALLKTHKLKPRHLILSGFSQGSILCVLCACRLNALGAVICGGVTGQPIYSAKEKDYVGGGWMKWEQLLPRRVASTRFCAVNGTLDPFVPRRAVEKMLEDYETFWHWDVGVGHDFPSRWYKIAANWMKTVLPA